MQEFDNYNPESNEIKDIYANEIDNELAQQFPVDTDIEKKLHDWFEKTISKKDAIKKLMQLIDKALDEGNEDEFYKLCKVYKNLQREFKYGG